MNPGISYAERLKGIPPELLKQAENYIISKVTKDYFKENYRFLRGESSCKEYEYKEGKSAIGCSFKFDYLPLSKLVGEKGILNVGINTRPNYRPNWFVASIDDTGSVVEPRITKEEALKIFKKKEPLSRSVHVSLVTPYQKIKPKNYNWRIEYSLPSNNSDSLCGFRKVYYVDIGTGDPSYKGEQMHCQ